MAQRRLPPYRESLAGTLLAAREAAMAPIRPVLRQAGVTEAQWRVLRVLGDAGAVDPSQLAHDALLHAPSVTRILRELIERDLIERSEDPKDGRRSVITLRPLGHDLVAQTAAHTLKLLDEYARRFGPERLARLRRELAEFTAAVEEVGK